MKRKWRKRTEDYRDWKWLIYTYRLEVKIKTHSDLKSDRENNNEEKNEKNECVEDVGRSERTQTTQEQSNTGKKDRERDTENIQVIQRMGRIIHRNTKKENGGIPRKTRKK